MEEKVLQKKGNRFVLSDGQMPGFKGALSGLRTFLAAESRFKMMKNAFLFHLKSAFRSQDI